MSIETLGSQKAKLGLGTVQLGLPYGIHNTSGKPSREEAFRILTEARDQKIRLLDTAEAYGDSLEVIGDYLAKFPGTDFEIVSKFVADGNSVEGKVNQTLRTLGTESLYAYLYHRFADYRQKANLAELQKLKREGRIRNLGVSLYSLEELSEAAGDPEVTVIQIPFNPFDNSHEKKNLLRKARQAGKEIHVRSIFLQGLFFKKPEELEGKLKGLKDCLEEFHAMLKEISLDVRQACLNYALSQEVVDRVIIGAETMKQVRENTEAILPLLPDRTIKKIESIQCTDASLLNPSNWK